MGRVLVAYFSHRGMNYFGGKLIDLKVGNTEVVAEKLARLTGGELFEIVPRVKYPYDYRECTEVAKRELIVDARPEIEGICDTSKYDTVILAYPCWWGTMPMPVKTFLECCDLSGKTLLPLCTHEGSGMGVSERDLRATCPFTHIRRGLPIYGSKSHGSDVELRAWLESNLISISYKNELKIASRATKQAVLQ